MRTPGRWVVEFGRWRLAVWLGRDVRRYQWGRDGGWASGGSLGFGFGMLSWFRRLTPPPRRFAVYWKPFPYGRPEA